VEVVRAVLAKEEANRGNGGRGRNRDEAGARKTPQDDSTRQ